MADFLTNVIGRNLETVDRLVPRVASRFEPSSGHPGAFASADAAGDGDRIYRIEEEVFLDPTAARETPRIAARPARTRRVRPAEPTPVAGSAADEISDPHRYSTAEKAQRQLRPPETSAAPTARPVMAVASDGTPEAPRQREEPPAPRESIPSSPQSRAEGSGTPVRIEQRDDAERSPDTAGEPSRAATVSEERHDVAGLATTGNAMTEMPRTHEPGVAPGPPSAAPIEAAYSHASPDSRSSAARSVALTSASVTRGAAHMRPPISPPSETFQPEQVAERLTADVPRPITARASPTPDQRRARRAELPQLREHRRELSGGTRVEADTTVHVTIGRIEVKATPNAAPARTKPTAASSSGLEEYLRRRARGNGQ